MSKGMLLETEKARDEMERTHQFIAQTTLVIGARSGGMKPVSRCFEVQTTKAFSKVRRFEVALVTSLCTADMKGMHPQLMQAKQGSLVRRGNTQMSAWWC